HSCSDPVLLARPNRIGPRARNLQLSGRQHSARFSQGTRMATNHKRLGDILLEQNVLTDEQLQQAIGEQRRTGELLGAALVRMGFVSEDILVGCLHRQLGLPVVDLNECVPEPEALALIKEELAKKHIALPIVAEKRTLQVAM